MNMRNAMAGLLLIALCPSAAPASEQPELGRTAAHANLDQQMRLQRHNIVDMQQQLDELHGTREPARRAQLLQAHLQSMRDTIKLMRSMADLSLLGHGEDGGRPSGGYGSKPDPEEQHRHAMLKERLDMLQAMLDQMIQRERIIGDCLAP